MNKVEFETLDAIDVLQKAFVCGALDEETFLEARKRILTGLATKLINEGKKILQIDRNGIWVME